MTVLITGATGRIGRVLARSLAEVGMPVRLLTRRPHRAVEYFGDAIPGWEWHPISEPVPEAALEGVTTIIHLMGEPLEGPLGPAKLKRIGTSRIVSLQRLIDGLKGRPLRVILASSIGIYPGGEPVDDGDLTHGRAAIQRETSALQGVIAAWEDAAQPLMAAGGKVAFLRLGQVIGAGDFLRLLLQLRSERIHKQLSAESHVSAIALQDATAMLAWLVVNQDFAGPINAVAPEPLKGASINKAIDATWGEGRCWPRSTWLADRRLGLAADLLDGDRRVAPKRALESGFTFAQPDLEPLLHAPIAAYRADLDALAEGKLTTRLSGIGPKFTARLPRKKAPDDAPVETGAKPDK